MKLPLKFKRHFLAPPQWKISFTPREGNKASHLLAKHAQSVSTELVRIEDVPNFINSCISFEKHCTVD